MPSARLIAEIANLISEVSVWRQSKGNIQKHDQRGHAVYEMWVFTHVYDGLDAARYQCQLVTHGNANPSVFLLRSAPGHLVSPGYGYARATKGTTELEVHVDLEVRGNTGVLHELDIAVLDRAHANRCRDNHLHLIYRHPSARFIRGAVECKLYDATPGVVLARTFAGLLLDMGQLPLRAFCTNRDHPGIISYLDRQPRALPMTNLTPLGTGGQPLATAVTSAFP